MGRYNTEYGSENLWFARARNDVRPEAVLDSDIYASRQELHRTRFHAEFLIEIDTEHSITRCGDLDERRGTFLILCRAGCLRTYPQQCLNLLRLLSPHWVNARPCFARSGRSRQRNSWSSQRAAACS